MILSNNDRKDISGGEKISQKRTKRFIAALRGALKKKSQHVHPWDQSNRRKRAGESR